NRAGRVWAEKGPGGAPRTQPTVPPLDLDAFFAAVEQRDKPSLRGKPVVVGGVGGRGGGSAGADEARGGGVRSARARARPVVVGGVGGRGVVSTASYEARVYGVRSAMSTREARSRCPHAAFLSGRFHAYREASTTVMGLLRSVSPLVEPLPRDEALRHLAPPAPL